MKAGDVKSIQIELIDKNGKSDVLLFTSVFGLSMSMSEGRDSLTEVKMAWTGVRRNAKGKPR